MKGQGDDARITVEVVIGRQQRHAMALSDRAQQKVGVRALKSAGPAGIEALGRSFMVGGSHRLVREGPQEIAQAVERGAIADPAQDFLADRSDDGSATVLDEATQFIDDRVVRRAPTQRQRPRGRVDEDLHRRRRCCL